MEQNKNLSYLKFISNQILELHKISQYQIQGLQEFASYSLSEYELLSYEPLFCLSVDLLNKNLTPKISTILYETRPSTDNIDFEVSFKPEYNLSKGMNDLLFFFFYSYSENKTNANDFLKSYFKVLGDYINNIHETLSNINCSELLFINFDLPKIFLLIDKYESIFQLDIDNDLKNNQTKLNIDEFNKDFTFFDEPLIDFNLYQNMNNESIKKLESSLNSLLSLSYDNNHTLEKFLGKNFLQELYLTVKISKSSKKDILKTKI